MSDLKKHDLAVTAGGETVTLSLFQLPNPGKTPVLLLHGASANSQTFLNPTKDRCLVEWLFKQGFEPWLLDWRGNGKIDDNDLKHLRNQLDFDFTAEHDIPAALKEMMRVSKPKRICAVAHCMGAATLSQSIAGGHLKDFPLTNVVLLAIGLFYEVKAQNRLKSEDHTLDRLVGVAQDFAIDPRPGRTWPKEIQELYMNWPDARPHVKPASDMDEVCNRVSFMFGSPYRERNLAPELHQGTFLQEQFGAIPLRMYLQCAYNVRRRNAAKFNASIDDNELISDDAYERFAKLDRVTLLTGEMNEIWHRDSIDRMDEWMRRNRGLKGKTHKVILPNYAHQDLLWGRDAHRDVFPIIRAGLP